MRPMGGVTNEVTQEVPMRADIRRQLVEELASTVALLKRRLCACDGIRSPRARGAAALATMCACRRRAIEEVVDNHQAVTFVLTPEEREIVYGRA